MNLISKVAAVGTLALFGAATASAFELIDPVPGSTTEVGQISSIKLQFDSNVDGFPEQDVTITNKATGELCGSYPGNYDWDAWDTYIVEVSPAITAPGEYIVNVPANYDPAQSSPAYEFYYVVKGVSYETEPGVPTSVVPTPDSEIVQDDKNGVQFDKITLNFAEDPYLIGALDSKWTLTNADGEIVPFTIGGFYIKGDFMLQYAENPFITLSFNEDGLLPSGTYTLTIPAGTIDLERGSNAEELKYTWTYVKTTPDADPTPLEITEAWLGQAIQTGLDYATQIGTFEWMGENKVAFEPGMTIDAFTQVTSQEAGSSIKLSINHGYKTEYMIYNIVRLADNESVATGPVYKQEDGTFMYVCPAYERFFDDSEYRFEIRAYSADSANRVEFGDGAEIVFKGGMPAYKYSSAYLAALNPDTNMDLSDLSAKKTVLTSMNQRKITMVFSEPVKVESAEANLGFGAKDNAEYASQNGEDFDRVWYVYIPEYIMSSYPAIEMVVVARGEDGYLVKGNYGQEDKTAFQINYEMTLCQPRIVIGQTNSHIPAIDVFTITSDATGAKAQLNQAYMGYPVVLDEAGNEVAWINNNYYYNPETWTDYAFKPLRWSTGSEPEPLELGFQMQDAEGMPITKPGKYTLHFPAAVVNFGTQYEADASVAQDFVFYVCEFVNVDFSDGNCTIALPAVEKGYTTTLDVTPAENWKLESLMLNGTDVTENVDGPYYTSPALTEAAHFTATFAFDGVVVIPTGADEIVTDLELRAWSDGGAMYVSGLKNGQVVRLYSVAGSLIETQIVAADEEISTLKLEAPAAAYVITVTDGAKTVAIKLLNK